MSGLENFNLIELLANTGLKEDDNDAKKVNKIKLSFTVKEYGLFVDAVEKFTRASNNSDFVNALRNTLKLKVSNDEIVNTIVNPIVESVFKADKKKEFTVEESITGKKIGIFGSDPKVVTKKSTALFRKVGHVEGLIHDQEKVTCTNDVKKLLIILTDNAKNPLSVFKELAPVTVKDKEQLYTSNRKSFIKFATEEILKTN